MADLKTLDNPEEEEPTIAEDVVVTKYKMAGDMANSKSSHNRFTFKSCARFHFASDDFVDCF